MPNLTEDDLKKIRAIVGEEIRQVIRDVVRDIRDIAEREVAEARKK